MNGLAVRERRLVALAVLLALVAAAWLGVVQPIMDGFAARSERREAALDAYRRNLRILRDYPAVKTAAAAQARTAAHYELLAASPAAAAEAARDRLTHEVAAAGATPHAVRPQPGPAGAVKLQADFQTDLPGLMQLLRRLTDEAPPAAVDALTLTAVPAPGRPPALETRLEASFAYAAPR